MRKNALLPVPSDVYDRFPSVDRLDELMFRYLVFGFVTDTIMMAAGSLWAKNLFDKDYVDTLSVANTGLVTATVGDPRTIGVTLRNSSVPKVYLIVPYTFMGGMLLAGSRLFLLQFAAAVRAK